MNYPMDKIVAKFRDGHIVNASDVPLNERVERVKVYDRESGESSIEDADYDDGKVAPADALVSFEQNVLGPEIKKLRLDDEWNGDHGEFYDSFTVADDPRRFYVCVAPSPYTRQCERDTSQLIHVEVGQDEEDA